VLGVMDHSELADPQEKLIAFGGRGGYNRLAEGLSGMIGTSTNAFADPQENLIALGGRGGYDGPTNRLTSTVYTSTNAFVRRGL
jgi:hypothetical protein